MAASDHIKAFFIKQKKIVRNSKRKPILKAPNKYTEILFLADTDQSQLHKQLSGIFQNSKISFLFPRTEKEDKTETGKYSYHSSDLNLTGKIKNDKLNQLLQKRFDLILDLSTDGAINQFLLKKLDSSFIIGVQGIDKSGMYDLLIREKLDEEASIDTITQQITLLSQNGNK